MSRLPQNWKFWVAYYLKHYEFGGQHHDKHTLGSSKELVEIGIRNSKENEKNNNRSGNYVGKGGKMEQIREKLKECFQSVSFYNAPTYKP